MKTDSQLQGGGGSERRSRSLKRVVRRHRWTIKSYRRNAIPNTGWMVVNGNGLLIMNDLTKQAAQRLADDHNSCLPPNDQAQRRGDEPKA